MPLLQPRGQVQPAFGLAALARFFPALALRAGARFLRTNMPPGSTPAGAPLRSGHRASGA